MITRLFLASGGEEQRTHNLKDRVRRGFRELAIGIMVCGVFIGAGAGSIG